MPPFSYFQDHPFNKVVLAICKYKARVVDTVSDSLIVIKVLKALPGMYEERGQTIADEERNSRLDTPIFVFQLSFPGLPTVLLFFEPR